MNRELEKEFRRMIDMTERLARADHRPGNVRMHADKGQGKVLVLLYKNENISQKELLYLLDCRPQSLAEILKKLEMQELIEREPSANDKRVLDIRLTEKGKEIAEEITTRIMRRKSPLGVAIDELDEEEQKQMFGYIERINASLEGKMSEYGFDTRPHRGRRRRPDHPRRPGRFDGKEIL